VKIVQNRYLWGAAAAVAATGTIMVGASAASADNLQQNDLSAVPATHTVNVGDLDATRYQLTATNGDGEAGCNAADGSPAVVTIHAPAGVTASPSTFQFTGCHQQTDPTGSTVVNFSSATPGDYAISATVSDATADGGTYNTSPAAFVLHVLAPTPPPPRDTTAPVITAPANMTVEATGPGGAAASYSATAVDDTDGSVPVTGAPASGSTFPLGVTTVNLSAHDAAGNTGHAEFHVTVVDTTPPALTLPANISATATGNSQAAVSYAATANDVVDGSVPVTCDLPSGNSFPVGITTVNCSATDAHGNIAKGTFTVHVTYSWNGFFQPIDNVGVVNKAKAGQSIPVKFSLGGNQGLNILAAGYPGFVTGSVPPADTTDDVEVYATSVPGLTYDAAADQYVYVWKTPTTLAGKSGTLQLRLADGSMHTALFTFTR
jgi:hypothetical protein